MFIFPWCALSDKLNIEPEVEQEGYSDMLRKGSAFFRVSTRECTDIEPEYSFGAVIYRTAQPAVVHPLPAALYFCARCGAWRVNEMSECVTQMLKLSCLRHYI